MRAGLPTPATAPGRRAATVFAILGLLAACQTTGPSPAASVAATTGASASAPPAPSPAPAAGAITVDPSLLSILPPDVGGVPIEPDLETATTVAADSSLATDVEAIAVGLAVSPGSSGGEDLVIANVVRLRPDVFDEAFFRDWRDTYDAAACERAGGLDGNAEAEIDGRPVFIGTCLNGAHTYHVRHGEDVIVSLTTVGDGRFGLEVVENLGN